MFGIGFQEIIIIALIVQIVIDKRTSEKSKREKHR